MKVSALFAIAICAVVTGVSNAETPSKDAKPAAAAPMKALNPKKLTCEEFLAVDEVNRPQIVYWSEGLNKRGAVEDAVIDLDQTNRLVPMIVEDCKRDPHASYWAKMKKRFDIE